MILDHGPLWKAVWVTCSNDTDINSYMLIFICTHAIIDAKSAVDLFANQFLPILNDLHSGKEPNLLAKPIYLSLSMEQTLLNSSESETSVAEYPVPWYIKAGINCILWKNRVFGSQDKKPSIRVVEEEMSGEAPCHYPFVVDIDTIKLKNLCKKNSVTVHSILLICLHNALKKAENKFEELRIPVNKVNYPIDLRRFNNSLRTSPMPLGCFVTNNKQSMRPVDINENKRYFQYAQVITKSVQSRITPTFPPSFFAKVAYCIRNGKMNEMLKEVGEFISLSNLGNCDSIVKMNTGSVKLVGQYFSGLIEKGLYISTSTLNGCMFFFVLKLTAGGLLKNL